MLGRHDGIIHFTVGQRRGLGIATGAPLYVVRLDAPSRRVVVGPREALRTSRIQLREVNWLGDGTIEEAVERHPEVYVKVRSTRPPQPAWLRRGAGGDVEVELIAGEDGVSPGQACAFYDAAEGQARVLGGGIIAGTMAAVAGQSRARCRSARPRADAPRDGPSELDKAGIAKAYARWAPIYDFVFGAVFERGRKASIAAAEQIGGRILEVGVGTGLSLPDYAATNRLIGVDLSAPMLRKAKARVAEHRLTNVDGLAVMDAQHLGFEDAAFDVVVAQYVITAVPDPEATLDEFARVIKPGGEIILVNHLGAEEGLARGLRTMVRAARAAARLAPGIRLGAARAMGGAARRRARRRTAADAAARTFFADQVRKSLAAAFGFPVAGACRGRGISPPQAAAGIARQLAIAARALAAGGDVDADMAAGVDMAGYLERGIVVADPAVADVERITIGAVAGAGVGDDQDAPAAVE